MRIREAGPADAAAIAQVHVASWRTTYTGIVSDDYLAALSPEPRERYWSTVLADPHHREAVVVAEDDTGRVVAFASGGPNRESDPDYDSELYAIYLLREHQGQGIGSALARAVASRLIETKRRSMLVWVLAANPSRRFYEALGGQYVRSQNVTIGGAQLEEVAYGWPDVRVLVPDARLP